MPLGTHKATLFGVAGVSTGGDVVLLSTQTASDSSSLDFTSGIDSTYGEYIFKFYNINPATDGVTFQFQVNASDDVGGDFDESYITSTYFKVEHGEDNTVQGPGYDASNDQAQGTAYQYLTAGMGNGSDESGAGELHLFNPSSTTYVKHFYSTAQYYHLSNYSINAFAAGYINQTLALSEISFKMSSGNFDGTIKMWGVK
jgi:hypothetical protein